MSIWPERACRHWIKAVKEALNAAGLWRIWSCHLAGEVSRCYCLMWVNPLLSGLRLVDKATNLAMPRGSSEVQER